MEKRIEKYADLADQEAKIYNANETPRALGMTPLEAEKPENLEKLKMRFEIQRKTANPQEKLKVGDRVRYFKKKDTFTKGYIPQYSELKYTINEINKLPLTGQKKYVVDMGSLQFSRLLALQSKVRIRQKRIGTRKKKNVNIRCLI